MSINAGTVVASLQLDTSKFGSALQRAKSDLASFADSSNSLGSRFDSLGSGMKSVGSTMSKAITLPLAAIGAASVKVGMDFEKGMSEVKAITGATTSDMALLQDKAKEMGATTKFSASESAEAMKYMGMAGWDTTKILDGLDGVMNLAAASGEDLGLVSDIVTDAMTAFGMEASKATEFADLLAATSSSANTNVSMLGESFKYVAPIAGALGYSAKDVSLALGLMANAGIKGSQSGTALRASITRLTKPTGEAAGLINELGLKMTDASGNMLPFSNVMGQLRDKFKGLTKEQQAQYASTIFGQEAMSGMLAIINASEDDFNKLSDSINNSNGSAKEMSEIMQDNLEGSMTKLKSALEGAGIAISETLSPIIRSVAEGINLVVDKFNGLSPTVQDIIVKVGLVVAAIGPMLLIGGQIIGAITTITSTFSGLGLTMGGLINPITLTIGAFAGIVIALKALYDNNEEFRNKVKEIWESIKTSFQNVFEAIKEFISAFVEFAQKIWKDYGDNIVSVITTAMDLIGKVVQTAFDIIAGVFKIFADIFRGDWSALWNDSKALLSTVWEGIKGIISASIDLVKSIVSNAWEVIKSVTKNAWNGVKTTIQNLWNETVKFLKNINLTTIGKQIIQGLINGVGSMANALYNKVKDMAGNMIKSIKAKLGIHSPSREMIEVGKYVDEGLAMGIDGYSSFVETAMDNVGEIVKNGVDDAVEYANSLLDRIKSVNSDLNIEYSENGGFTYGTDSSGKTDTGNKKYDSNGDGRTSVYEDMTGRAKETSDWVSSNSSTVKEIADAVEKKYGYRPDLGEIKDRYDSGDYHTGGLVSHARSLFKIFHNGGWVGSIADRLRNLRSDEVPAILQTGEYVMSRNEVKDMQKYRGNSTVVNDNNVANINIENLVKIEGNVDEKAIPKVKRAVDDGISKLAKSLQKKGAYTQLRNAF